MPPGTDRDYLAGLLANRLGEISHSIQLLQRALPNLQKTHDPRRDPEALNTLADDYTKLGNYASAAKTYDRLFALFPDENKGGTLDYDGAPLSPHLRQTHDHQLAWTNAPEDIPQPHRLPRHRTHRQRRHPGMAPRYRRKLLRGLQNLRRKTPPEDPARPRTDRLRPHRVGESLRPQLPVRRHSRSAEPRSKTWCCSSSMTQISKSTSATAATRSTQSSATPPSRR